VLAIDGGEDQVGEGLADGGLRWGGG